jgi:hypothetical protein
LGVAALAALLVTGCGGDPAPDSAAVRTQRLHCAGYIDTQPPGSDLRVVLGVVALPASPGAAALQTASSGDASAAGARLFAKRGLVVKAGTSFEIEVPRDAADRLSIGWGNPARRAGRVVVRDCRRRSGAASGWLAYAGGYWVADPGCVTVVVRARGQARRVRIGLGAACPGQQPPQGPSES